MIDRATLTLLQDAVPDGRLFALDQQMLITALIQLFNFLVLAAVLGFILYKPVQKYLRGRADRIRGQLEDAQHKTAKAEALKAEYETKLNEIASERAGVLEAARSEAAERSRQMLDEARLEAAAVGRRAEERVLTEKERFKREAWQHIVEVSSLMTEKLIKSTVDGETHQRLFEEAMIELEETPWPS